MTTYHKIDTIFKRDQRGKIIEGDYSRPEFEYLANLPWRFTEKVDGTNIRLHFDDSDASFRGNEHAFVSGRSDDAQIPPKLLNRLVELMKGMPLESVFDPGPVVLYGEGYGAGIQKGGGKYLPDVDFVLFDVRVGGWWLRREDVVDVAVKLGLAVVPEIGIGTLDDAVKRVSGGLVSTWGGGSFEAEGIVARPAVELFDRAERRIITKIKGRDFR